MMNDPPTPQTLYSLEWLLNIVYHVSRLYLILVMLLQIKPCMWSERLRLILRSFLKLESFGYNNNKGDFVNQQY